MALRRAVGEVPQTVAKPVGYVPFRVVDFDVRITAQGFVERLVLGHEEPVLRAAVLVHPAPEDERIDERQRQEDRQGEEYQPRVVPQQGGSDESQQDDLRDDGEELAEYAVGETEADAVHVVNQLRSVVVADEEQPLGEVDVEHARRVVPVEREQVFRYGVGYGECQDALDDNDEQYGDAYGRDERTERGETPRLVEPPHDGIAECGVFAENEQQYRYECGDAYEVEQCQCHRGKDHADSSPPSVAWNKGYRLRKGDCCRRVAFHASCRRGTGLVCPAPDRRKYSKKACS